MKYLPIGIQSFKKMIRDDYYYVDKTPFVKKLERGGYYFLSRPRRFGKSLFLDTLKEAFSGNKELFKGLYIYDKWNWDKRYPVVKISFGRGGHRTPDDLKISIEEIFLGIQREHNIKLSYPTLKGKFEQTIILLYEKYKEPVVVLVDEYDKPILDAIENIENAKENREILKDFYSVLKDADPYLKLVFLTGVSRFSKVSIFSGLNQLRDITLSREFATICGYTQSDLETVFADRLKDFDIEEVKRWYNGYNWLGESVYNPFDILLLFSEGLFKSYWFETGTPTFLIKLFKKHSYFLPKLDELEVSDTLLSNLDIDMIYPENLLFQSGYLTIKEILKDETGISYILTYPNYEVRKSFNDSFLIYLYPDQSNKQSLARSLFRTISKNKIEDLKDILHSFFAGISYEFYRKNELDKYEGYYASIVYALFNGAGLDVSSQVTTNKGRVDLTVKYKDRVYLIEFKVVDKDSEGKALEQIKEKNIMNNL